MNSCSGKYALQRQITDSTPATEPSLCIDPTDERGYVYVIKLDEAYAPYVYKCDISAGEYYMLDPFSYSLHASGLPVVGTDFSCLQTCIQQSPRMAHVRSKTATEVEYQYCKPCGFDDHNVFSVFEENTESTCVSKCVSTYYGY